IYFLILISERIQFKSILILMNESEAPTLTATITISTEHLRAECGQGRPRGTHGLGLHRVPSQ
ncbi:MAG: hypothetical protein ACPIOQ_52440, partial [Promethearchaeia archaeon]